MSLYLITGGARSGKSRYAEALARHIGGERVSYLATLAPHDEEMRRRISRHQQRRPDTWQTVEAPLNLSAAVEEARYDTLLIDCLSGFVSNVLLKFEAEGEEEAVDAALNAVAELLETLPPSPQTTIIVTNEVGDSVVPAYPLGRWYRDALGLANQRVAAAASAVSLVTVGIPKTLKGTFPEVSSEL